MEENLRYEVAWRDELLAQLFELVQDPAFEDTTADAHVSVLRELRGALTQYMAGGALGEDLGEEGGSSVERSRRNSAQFGKELFVSSAPSPTASEQREQCQATSVNARRGSTGCATPKQRDGVRGAGEPAGVDEEKGEGEERDEANDDNEEDEYEETVEVDGGAEEHGEQREEDTQFRSSTAFSATSHASRTRNGDQRFRTTTAAGAARRPFRRTAATSSTGS